MIIPTITSAAAPRQIHTSRSLFLPEAAEPVAAPGVAAAVGVAVMSAVIFTVGESVGSGVGVAGGSVGVGVGVTVTSGTSNSTGPAKTVPYPLHVIDRRNMSPVCLYGTTRELHPKHNANRSDLQVTLVHFPG